MRHRLWIHLGELRRFQGQNYILPYMELYTTSTRQAGHPYPGVRHYTPGSYDRTESLQKNLPAPEATSIADPFFTMGTYLSWQVFRYPSNAAVKKIAAEFRVRPQAIARRAGKFAKAVTTGSLLPLSSGSFCPADMARAVIR